MTRSDPEILLGLAHLCRLSYESADEVESSLKGHGFENVRYFGANDPWPKAILTTTDRFAIICFRGTMEAGDWLANAELGMVGRSRIWGGQGKVHHGWYKACLRRGEELAKNLPRGLPIVVTGHSLGGATATLFSVMLVEAGISPHLIVTFGAPKVGDKQFVAAYDRHPVLGRCTLRMVDYSDIVTKIPRFGGFCHVAEREEHLLTRDGKVLVGPSPEETVNARWANPGQYILSMFTGRFQGVESHLMEHYIERLSAMGRGGDSESNGSSSRPRRQLP